jgi:hypothetical protein
VSICSIPNAQGEDSKLFVQAKWSPHPLHLPLPKSLFSQKLGVIVDRAAFSENRSPFQFEDFLRLTENVVYS